MYFKIGRTGTRTGTQQFPLLAYDDRIACQDAINFDSFQLYIYH